jgi:hypothetical protein
LSAQVSAKVKTVLHISLSVEISDPEEIVAIAMRIENAENLIWPNFINVS